MPNAAAVADSFLIPGGLPVPVRVLLADDHAIVRDGLRAVLAGDKEFEVIAQESDGQAALETIQKLKPHVAVLDIQMPGLTGLEVARRLTTEGSSTRVVLLSMHREDAFVRAAVDAGVAGYVVKEDAARELTDAIKAAVRGDVYLSPRVAGQLVQAVRRGPGQAEIKTSLTPRERDVLRLLADGFTSKEIAARLKLSPKTVDGHRTAIMDKLAIRTVAGLVKFAIRNHLTGLDE
ncbi:MAG: response regulator transcription factor [Deltaproteobacteria bacterium]|nr:response regulator transcription factor [Deltaproteobacteria bacterium]